METPLPLMPEDKPRPDPNPKPRGRKSTNKSQKGSGPQKKQPQRGMGVAQLERLRLQERWKKISETQQPLNPDDHHNPYPCLYQCHVNPLAGVPVQHPGFANFGYQPDPRSRVRILGGGSLEGFTELPSIPNLEGTCFNKKKRAIGDEIGFMMRGREKYDDHQILPINGCNFSGFDLNNGDNQYLTVNGGFSGYAAGSEVVAIHKKGNGSGNVMMEYGFFPGKLGENEGKTTDANSIITFDKNNIINNNNNYYYKNNNYYMMEDLNLKMGCSDSSSSTSSLTTVTTTTITTTVGVASDTYCLDLSLKL